jgi:hypothetical protein
MKIFVNITSYLDKELVDTLSDLFRQADNPTELRVVVINKAGDEKLGVNFPELEIYNSPLAESPIQSNIKGQSKIKDEQIYFQCDPHSRFIKGWDTYIRETVRPKIVFNPPTMSYEYRNGLLFLKDDPICFQIHEFNPKDIAVTYGIRCSEFREKAFFCSNSLFCYVDWLKEVPIDERIYNWGDEVDRSIRTLMSGWKIYNTKPILWHYWKGVGDGSRGGRVRPGHEKENEESYMLLRRKLFGQEKEKPWNLNFYENEMKRLRI